jgi:hypothetical protein
MNITPLTIYLWQLADQAQDSFRTIGLISAIMGIMCAIGAFATSHDGTSASATAAKYSKKAFLASCLMLIISAFIPSSKTIAMMVVIPEIAHSKVIQQDLPDIYNAAVNALKNQLKK